MSTDDGATLKKVVFIFDLNYLGYEFQVPKQDIRILKPSEEKFIPSYEERCLEVARFLNPPFQSSKSSIEGDLENLNKFSEVLDKVMKNSKESLTIQELNAFVESII